MRMKPDLLDTERAANQDAAPPLADPNLTPITSTSARKMRRTMMGTSFWIGAFLFLVLAPLFLVAVDAPAGRGFWLELGVALGILGFVLLALQFATTARFRWLAPHFGSDTILLIHRQLGISLLFFLIAHPLLLFITEPRYLEYLDARVNPLRTLFLIAAMIGLVLLVVLPLWGVRMGLSYEWWRITHALLAVGVLIVGLAHSLQISHYLNTLGKQALWVGITAGALGLVAYVRFLRPLKLRRRPYRVVEVREERGDTWTLVLEPDGHAGFRFQGGQYGWLTLNDTPFTLQQHPFSFSSSPAEAPRIAFTIKALGDFSATIHEVKAGSRAFVEGPFGSFTLEAQPADGAVLIMGGIGVTPAMSLLRGCAAREDRRPLILIYANNNWEEAAFREDIEDLKNKLNLQVVHVLQEAPEGWQGETGFVTEELLLRHLPKDGRDYHYFVCGPGKMMDLVEQALVNQKIPIWNRSVERFQMVG